MFQNKKMIKTIPAYRPLPATSSPDNSPEKKKISGGSGSDSVHLADRNILSAGGPSVVPGGHPSTAAAASASAASALAAAGSSPESPSSSSNDNSTNRKGKKGRRPNSAASHGSDHNLHSSSSVPHHREFHEKIANSLDSTSSNSSVNIIKNSKQTVSSADHNNPDNKVPNNVEQSPTSVASSCSAVNTSSSSSSSSSSKQSSTSSLIGKY